MYKFTEKSGILFIFLLGGVTSILAFSFQFGSPAKIIAFIGVALIVASAALVTGGLLGFLFGIPRTLQARHLGENNFKETEYNINDKPNEYYSQTLKSTKIDYEANTNLEQISDWLTKILIGIGLIQISSIVENSKKLAKYLYPTFGKFDGSSSFAIALLIYFSVLGFIGGYLWTRLSLIGQLRRSEQQALIKRIETLESFDQQDAEAIALIMLQLDELHEPEASQQNLDKAIQQASPPIKVILFHQARRARADGWHKHNQALIRRTIRIFRALINSAPKKFHRNYGQLGFALKDQENPDWKEAELNLTNAIKIRGSWEDRGWPTYEFNRAICGIHLYGSDESKKEAILKDLAVAVQSGTLTLDVLNQTQNSLLKDWIQSHGGYEQLKNQKI